MSHGPLFELEAVAQTAQIALAWGITIRQNRGDTTAREPRTYQGRGFSLSVSRRPDRSTLRAMPSCDSRLTSVSAPPLAMRATDIASSAVAHTVIVDVDQNGWASKIDRAWGALGGIATLEGENRCAKLRSVLRGVHGLDGRRANLARGQQRRHRGAEFYAD